MQWQWQQQQWQRRLFVVGAARSHRNRISFSFVCGASPLSDVSNNSLPAAAASRRLHVPYVPNSLWVCECVCMLSLWVWMCVFTVSIRIVSWVLGSRSHRVVVVARQTLRFIARSSSAFGLLPLVLLLLALLPAAYCCCCQCCLETLADHAAKTVYICFSACSHTLTDTVCDSASERASSISQSVCLSVYVCVCLSVCCACVCLCVSASVCVSESASVCGVQTGVATEWPTGVAWPNRRRQHSSLLQLLAWSSPGRVGSCRVKSSLLWSGASLAALAAAFDRLSNISSCNLNSTVQ